MVNSTDAIIKKFNRNQEIYFARTREIETALALHEKGTRIDPKISQYTKIYADLVDNSSKVGLAIAEKGKEKVDSKLLEAHRQLDEKLSSLSKRVDAASQPKLGISPKAKIGLVALAAGIATAVVYYLSKIQTTEETMKRVFDIGLGVKEEVLETSSCTRTMARNGDITRTCVTTRSTVNPDSLNQWLAETKTCVDTIPSSTTVDHKWCHIPLWDPAEKSEILRKGQEWIEKEELKNCGESSNDEFLKECSMPPKDSPFRTGKAKKTFKTYSKLIDQYCKEHVCQRLDYPSCDNVSGSIRFCRSTLENPFAREETQNDFLNSIWYQIPYFFKPSKDNGKANPFLPSYKSKDD